MEYSWETEAFSLPPGYGRELAHTWRAEGELLDLDCVQMSLGGKHNLLSKILYQPDSKGLITVYPSSALPGAQSGPD